MSSLLGVNTGNDTQLDQLVAAYRQSQQPQVDKLQAKKNQLTRQQTYFNNLNTRLNSFITQLDNLSAENVGQDFAAKKVVSSDNSYVTATASHSAVKGVNTIKVQRLATSDILISDKMQSDSLIGLSGTQDITLRGKDGNDITIQVELDGTETNLQAMNKLAAAINGNEELAYSAGVVKDTSTTARFTIRSTETGADNAVAFQDSALLGALGISNSSLDIGGGERRIADSSSAGYKVSAASDLDSLSEINGIAVSRSGNSISDAIEGMTFQLIKPQEATDTEIVLTTDVNDTAVEEMIQPFIKAYNDTMSFLTSNEGKDMRRSDPSLSSLYQRMRLIVAERITTQEEGGPEYFSNIGIESDSRGLLSIGDRQQLVDLLEENPQLVTNIFASEDGVVAKLQNALETLKGDDGLITQRSLSLSDQIDSQDDRIEQLNRRLDRQAETLRKQYTSLLEALYEQQGQTSAYGAFNQGLAT